MWYYGLHITVTCSEHMKLFPDKSKNLSIVLLKKSWIISSVRMISSLFLAILNSSNFGLLLKRVAFHDLTWQQSYWSNITQSKSPHSLPAPALSGCEWSPVKVQQGLTPLCKRQSGSTPERWNSFDMLQSLHLYVVGQHEQGVHFHGEGMLLTCPPFPLLTIHHHMVTRLPPVLKGQGWKETDWNIMMHGFKLNYCFPL